MTVVKVTNVQYILKKPTLKNSGFFSDWAHFGEPWLKPLV